MKTYIKCLLVPLIVLMAFTPSAVLAQTPTPQPGNTIEGDQVIIGNTFRLAEGKTLDGNILIIGGTANTALDSTVNGDIVLIGGTLSINGIVNGDIVPIGGAVTLEDAAIINGNLTMIGTSLKRSPLATINGNVSEGAPESFNFDSLTNPGQILPFTSDRTPLSKALNATFQALAMGLLAVLVGLILPHNTKNVASAIVREPIVNGGVGLLTIIIAPIVLVLLIITIILIPVSLLGFIALALAVIFGFIAVGYEVGQRFAGLFKTTWHPSIAAGIGTLLLSLMTGYSSLIPCVGWILGFIATILGLGAVITSRVGSEKYANQVLQAVLSPEMQTPPSEPAPSTPPITPEPPAQPPAPPPV